MLVAHPLQSVTQKPVKAVHKWVCVSCQHPKKSICTSSIRSPQRKGGEAGLAAALIAAVIAVAPAAAAPTSADYISIQERIQQRNLLRDRASPANASSAEAQAKRPATIHEQANFEASHHHHNCWRPININALALCR